MHSSVFFHLRSTNIETKETCNTLLVPVLRCEICGDLCITTHTNSYQLRGPTLNRCSINIVNHLGLSERIPENNIQPSPCNPCLILLPVCQPLNPTRPRETPSANCPHLAESSQQTAVCLWRTQGCLCKCQSHAAHSAQLHMLHSACCASRARWKTQKKIRCVAKWGRKSK